jgi:hypothetical protein
LLLLLLLLLLLALTFLSFLFDASSSLAFERVLDLGILKSLLFQLLKLEDLGLR